MSVKSAPYYWLECDGCGVKSTEDTDYSALAMEADALTEARESEWQLAEHTAQPGNAGHYCETCTPPWCLECERPISDDNPRTLDSDGDPDNWQCRGCADMPPR